MGKFYWGLGIFWAGLFFLLLSFAFHKDNERFIEQDKEKSTWTWFIYISDKIENFKYAIGAVGFILLGIYLILASFGFI